MNIVKSEELQLVQRLPKILREFCLESRRNKITNDHDFNVFATRYFSMLAGFTVDGYSDYTTQRPLVVYNLVPREIKVVPESPLPKATPLIDAHSEAFNQQSSPHPKSIDMAHHSHTAKAHALLEAHPPKWREIEHAIYKEICALRLNPRKYAGKVRALEKYYSTSAGGFVMPGGVVLSAKEGWSAYESCIAQLNEMKPLRFLRYSNALTIAALEGLTPDRSGVPGRELCCQYGQFSEELGSSVAQSLCFNQLLSQSIVLHLLVDDNYPSRGNRTHLLSDEYELVGMAFHTTTCNIIFASNYTEYNEITQLSNTPILTSEYEYSLVLNNENFHVLTEKEIAQIQRDDPLSDHPVRNGQSTEIVAELEEGTVSFILLDPNKDELECYTSEKQFVLHHDKGSLTCSLSYNGVEMNDTERPCFIQSKNHYSICYCSFYKPGNYKLSLSVDILGTGVYTQAFEYSILYGGHEVMPRTFPNSFLQSHGCYLYCPIHQKLEEGDQEFVVEALSESLGIAILSGNELYYLQKVGSLWAGVVKIKKGPVKVSSNIDKTHYEIFSFTCE